MIDLHIHSNYSDDADFSPFELVQKCRDAGITMMSITDHNSAMGNKEARNAAEDFGIKYITGIEIDCFFNDISVHLLGYGIDDDSPDFEQLYKNILSKEKAASYERLRLINQFGFEVSEDEMNNISNINDEAGIWNGEMFAEVLLAKPEYKDHEILLPYREGRERADNPYVNFYWDYVSHGKPCYADVDFPDFRDAFAIIKDNGGKAVLAHPGNNLKNRLHIFSDILSTGIDGIEVFCSYHDREAAEYFYKQARDNNLLITCGSDFHGKTKPSVKLGKTGCRLDYNEMETDLWAVLGTSFG